MTRAWLMGLLMACGQPRAAPAPALEPAALEPATAADASDAGAVDAAPDDFVDLGRADRTLVIDIRYATADNFTGAAVYPVARCLLRGAIATRVLAVQRALRARGLGLKLWDCYRPFGVQQELWRTVPDPRYVAQPVVRDGVPAAGSKHNRGAAVDLTLVDARGRELDMPSAYDDFTERAHRACRVCTATQRANARILERAMVAEGFEPLPTEWWHFDGPGWRDFPLADIGLGQP